MNRSNVLVQHVSLNALANRQEIDETNIVNILAGQLYGSGKPSESGDLAMNSRRRPF